MDEWIWDMMINDFAQNFQDIMSKEQAKKQLFELQMERGELANIWLISNNSLN